MTSAEELNFNDPTAQRLERIATGADADIVGPMLADILHDPRWLDCDVALISGGKSNLTYRVACDAGEVILRRPPLGHILPTAHDMGREYRVMTALADTGVPVPRTFHLGDADSPLGAPFYVMERVVGHICRNALPPGYAETPGRSPPGRRGARRRPRRSPRGRPRASRARRVRPPGGLHGAAAATVVPAVGGVEDRLSCPRSTRSVTISWRPCPSSERAPSYTATTVSTTRSCIRPTVGTIVAVLDWEMSTLGDPLADLGAMLAYWSEAGDSGDPAAGADHGTGHRASTDSRPAAEIIERYANRTGIDLSDIGWYQSFAYFKLAVVCQGIAARAAGGSMVGGGFDNAERLVAPLVEAGRQQLSARPAA